ncbi:MAG: efflux RND transporter permease subunit [Acidobacteria bacterium]|nr:efflux RND transporter permease subunit [Acidobacteriota bacterium]
MSHGKTDQEHVQSTHNTARFCVEKRHVSWVLLLFVFAWGIYGYLNMPERKDPVIPVLQAVAVTAWPGADAEKVEQLVTRKVEEQMAQNAKVEKIESISRTNLSIVYVTLEDYVKDSAKEFDDIKLRLDGITDLPQGCQPVNFIRDFGDTAALMLTVASPKADDTEISIRAKNIEESLRRVRAEHDTDPGRRPAAVVFCFPASINSRVIRDFLERASEFLRGQPDVGSIRFVEGVGFAGVDVMTTLDDKALELAVQKFLNERVKIAEAHPDCWAPILVRDPAETKKLLQGVAGDKYSYREMDDFTDLMQKSLKTIEIVSKVDRSGTLDEQVLLQYSQERLASYGVKAGNLKDILAARNSFVPGGEINTRDKVVGITPSGEFKNEKELNDVVIGANPDGSPVYLRDVAVVTRGYDMPPRFLNHYTRRDAQGNWTQTRAITLSIQMKEGEKIGLFAEEVDAKLEELRKMLPPDLVFARTSDQPKQVEENVELFMRSLWEAIILVVVVSFIGFWEWRSAILMAIAIPITLAMTFGMMFVLGLDIQQVSIATLIIALGLLVDDPVVAGDSIKRDMGIGNPPVVAAWLGPTKLATAILYATITNIVAYLPFLMLPGSTGEFLFSLPMVLTCSLVASRVASMTFIPMLGYYLLKPKLEKPVEERRKAGFAAFYFRLGRAAIRHRWVALLLSFGVLAAGVFFASQLKTMFFPKDQSFLSYVDVWLPEDASFESTLTKTQQVEKAVGEIFAQFGKDHAENGKPREVLKSMTTFVGGGGPRFWYSVSPEMQQLNYAQIIIEVFHKEDTEELAALLQQGVPARVPGAQIDARQLETGSVVGLPIAIRLSGMEIDMLRGLAERLKALFQDVPGVDRVRDDWGAESFALDIQVNTDRANLAGITNVDVAASSAAAMSGLPVSTLREGDKQIPIVARLRDAERLTIEDMRNLYVYSSISTNHVPLRQVATVDYKLRTEKFRRRNQFRTVTVYCAPVKGVLPSEIMASAAPKLAEFEKSLPSGYFVEIGGEKESQDEGFTNLTIVLCISLIAIYMALVFQFKNAIKPFVVFAAVPYGMVGAFAALFATSTPFGFMAFLGIISLIGVIVSHIIVLFDFIEEKREEGEPLQQALLDAGIIRLRPVLITVGATVIALFPLAMHGGPLWQPLCYAQIGGLLIATPITLGLVPVLYAICVLDLKILKWEGPVEAEEHHHRRHGHAAAPPPVPEG